MRGPALAALAFAALSLAACNDRDAGRGGGSSRICTPFPEATATNAAPAPQAPGALGANANPAQLAADPAAVLDDCLHRWGYSLAASSDPAEAVAQAAVAACAVNLARWNQQGLAANASGAASRESEAAPSLLTGQPTTPLAEHYTYAQSRALFYVVQARAGKCPPPAAPAGNAAR